MSCLTLTIGHLAQPSSAQLRQAKLSLAQTLTLGSAFFEGYLAQLSPAQPYPKPKVAEAFFKGHLAQLTSVPVENNEFYQINLHNISSRIKNPEKSGLKLVFFVGDSFGRFNDKVALI